jgi:molybdopterin-guanine dinucleotide biosynthesis protein A
MGRSKVVLEVAGAPLAAWAAGALLRSGADPVVLVGASAEEAAAVGWPSVPDRWPGEGPLAATATALAWARDAGVDRLVVVAGDQPLVDAATVRALLAALADPTAGGPLGAVALTPDGRRHPYPSAWLSRAAPALARLVESGSRRADAAFALEVAEVPVDGLDLRDVDHPDDVAPVVDRLRRLGGSPKP